MKLDARRVEAFLDNPGSCRVALLYGDDVGLIRERANRLVRSIAGSLDDPFRVSDLERDKIARLPEELASRSLTGGRRVVRVRDAGDAALMPLTAALAQAGDALLVLEASSLPSRSKLRQALERLPEAATIGCYPLDAGALEQVIVETLGQFGVSIEKNARSWLVGQLGADQAVTRSELGKLALYVGEGGQVDLASAQACVGDLAGLSLEDALFAATAGNVVAADRALELALGEGVTAVGVFRAALTHMQRLQRARAAMAGGASAGDAARSLRPPVFYRREATFLQALRLWSEKDLAAACTRLWEAERASKQTGNPAEIICRSVVLGLAQRAAMVLLR
jgi:DNA polymerase-3 subunit delta